MEITRINTTDYSVVTDTVLASGERRADYCCRITGATLRSYEQPGDVRVGGLLRVNLGPKALESVMALEIGESFNA